MRFFNKIAIIGVGLIGGSIGLAAKKRRLAKTVCGVGRRMSSLKRARRLGAVDTITLDLAQGIKGADLVVIATPISLIGQYILRIAGLARYAKKDLIITDAGSTKSFVVSRAEKILPKGIRFIGAHPFAGSEKSGAANASADLFRGSKTFITPTKKSDRKSFNKVKRFWRAMGSDVVVISAKKHDALVSGISHLPHLAACAIVNSVAAHDIWLASTGFSDTTRIACGDPVMWRDIFLSNPENVLKAVKSLQKNLDLLSKAVKGKNVRLLMRQLENAKRKREALTR